MKGELTVARWMREAGFLLPSSCPVERFPPANSPPVLSVHFLPPIIMFLLPLSSILVSAYSFLTFYSLLKPPNSVCFLSSCIVYSCTNLFIFCHISLCPTNPESHSLERDSKGVHLSSVDLCLFQKTHMQTDNPPVQQACHRKSL